MFSTLSRKSLIKATLFKNQPIYVQFYVTARCNLTCQQCNIIYANSDLKEVSLPEIQRIADNFAKIGVAMVLLTGGEPFTRKDLPEIIYAFESRGVHVRMQTNGLATTDQIDAAIAAGGKDISISLDSLKPAVQDSINGDVKNSWKRAIDTMSYFTQKLPKDSSFASLGCVLQRDNMDDLVDVIKFGTKISWFTSLVPIHVTSHSKPMNFRSFDLSKKFKPHEYADVDRVVEQVRGMKKEGYLLYDSDQYLDDIKRFVKDEPTTWRSKNDGVCDSPNLYFAVLPNGSFAPCCDHRLTGTPVMAFDPKFPEILYDRVFRTRVREVTAACSGCMYGSYPEMSISMRFWAATIERVKLFLTSPPSKNWPLQSEDMQKIAEDILREKKESASA